MGTREKESFFKRKEREAGVALNAVQKQAVLHTEGALLLLASPGSGKTTTLIMRIGYLIEEKRVAPARIKAVTFSRASAEDMKERFGRFFPEHADLAPDFSTIHSLAFEVARDYWWRRRIAYKLIEGELPEEDQEQEQADEKGDASQGSSAGSAPAAASKRTPLHKKWILRELYERIVGERITDEQMEELTTWISFVKNKMLPEAQWEEAPCSVPEAVRILQEYEDFKHSGTDKLLVDYDDMLTTACRALEEDRSLLRKVQSRYDYVLTDESQDTSKVQHRIVELLVQGHGNLCVVADDDQSIYTWRAAEPEYLLDFKRIYPRAAIQRMEQNYRSSRQIVDVANRFIKQNKKRYDKNMFTRNTSGKPVVLRNLSDYKYQAAYVVQQLEKVEELREAAVLYRNNSSSITLMNALDRAGIPFYMKDGDNRFFSHWVVEDVLNFMRMAFTDKRPELLEKIHAKMTGYITRQQVSAVSAIRNGESVFDNLLQHVKLQDYQVKQLEDVKSLFAGMREMEPLRAIRVIRYRLGYEKALEKMCERLGFRRETLIGILNTLEDISDGLKTLQEFAERLKHLEQLMRSSKRKRKRQDHAVTLSTFHSAKGLEFDRVYMIDLIEGIIPSSDDRKELDKDNRDPMEEAVRLFYVGMTRAKKHLELISYRSRDGAQVTESPFVEDVRRLQQPAQGEAGAAPQAGAAFEGAKRKEQVSGGAGEGAPGRSGSGWAKRVSIRGAEAGGGRSGGGSAKTKRVSIRGTEAGSSGKTGAGAGAEAASLGGWQAASTASKQPGRKSKAQRARSPHAFSEAGQLQRGMQIRHAAFGRGEIAHVQGDRIYIRFEQENKVLSVQACLEGGLLERA